MGWVTSTSALSSSALPAPRTISSGERNGIHASPQIHPEILYHRLLRRIDNRAIQRVCRDLEVSLGQQRRKLHRIFVIEEAFSRNRVGRQPGCYIVVNQQQVLQRIAVLCDGQPPDRAILRRCTHPGRFQSLVDPRNHRIALRLSGLRKSFGRHGAGFQAASDCLPCCDVAIFQGGIELIQPYAGRADVRTVAGHAVLLQQWLHDVKEFAIQRFPGCVSGLRSEIVCCQAHSGQRNSRDGKQRGKARRRGPGFHVIAVRLLAFNLLYR